MSASHPAMSPVNAADDGYQRLFEDIYHMGRPEDIFVAPPAREQRMPLEKRTVARGPSRRRSGLNPRPLER